MTRPPPSFPTGLHLVLLGTAQLFVVWALAFVLAAKGERPELERAEPCDVAASIEDTPRPTDGVPIHRRDRAKDAGAPPRLP